VSKQKTKFSGVLSRSIIDAKLKELAATAPVAPEGCAACCYAPIGGSPDQVQYICPVCGEKTLYDQPEPPESKQDDRDAWLAWLKAREPLEFLSWELQACRQAIREIRAKGLSAELDELNFCRNCRPKAKAFTLELVIRYPDATASHRVDDVHSKDFQLLREFLAGQVKHEGQYGSKEDLKVHLPRLSQLLGITKKK
jgi:hypothetical protein